MFIDVCTCEGRLKCQRVLVPAWSIFWDKGIDRNYGYTLQTFKINISLLSFLLFWRISHFAHFNFARMPVKLPSCFLVTNLAVCFAPFLVYHLDPYNVAPNPSFYSPELGTPDLL